MGLFWYNVFMPGLTIHLAAANEYLKNHPDEDATEFVNGAIAPDFVPDKIVSHHSRVNIRNDSLSFLLGKVVLKDCLPDFDINTSFGRGYFFHLITDDEFCRFLARDKDRIATMTYRELKDKLYHDYTATSMFLKNKYNVVFPEAAQEYDIDEPDDPLVIDLDDTCSVIEWLGTLDLDEYLKNL